MIMLHTICAWCKKVLQEGDQNQPISHGICEDCAKNFHMHPAQKEFMESTDRMDIWIAGQGYI